MHHSIAIIFLLLSAAFHLNADGKRCRYDSQCPVPPGLRCVLCIQGHGPFCSSGMCLDGKCYGVQRCSLQLSGTCQADKDCQTSLICARCPYRRGPTCAQARCISGQCVHIAPCSLQS